MVTIVTRASKGEALTHDEVDANFNNLNTGKEPILTAGTSAQYYRGDKTWQTLNKAAVGLGSVDNTSDASKPVSTAQQTALDLKANALNSALTGMTSIENLTFSGTGRRITGDFSNATLPSRVMFQTATANSNTGVSAIPNGTNNTSSFAAFNSSDPANAAYLQFSVNGTETRVSSSATGTASSLPMLFLMAGTEAMRIDISRNVGIGVTPSTWGSSYKVVQLPGGSLNSYSTVSMSVNQGAYDSGAGAWKYLNTGTAASRYDQNSGVHSWHIAPSGTAGAALTWTQAVAIQNTGRLEAAYGAKITGPATLSGVELGTMSVESPVWRNYIGDGTGYSWTLSKRASGTTTDLVTVSDVGNLSLKAAGKELRFYNAAGNNWTAVSSPCTAGDTEVDFKVVTKSGTLYMDASGVLLLSNGSTAYNQYPSIATQSSTTPGWYKIGTVTPNIAATAKIVIQGTDGFGAGQYAAGETVIQLRCENDGQIRGTFWHTGQAITSVSGVVVNTSGDVYVKVGSFHTFEVFAYGAMKFTPSLSFFHATTVPTGTACLSTFCVITSGAQSFMVDSAGNAGVGVSPDTWASNAKVVQFYGGVSIGEYANGVAMFIQNAYTNGTNWIAKSTGRSTLYQHNDGTHEWFFSASTAGGSALTWYSGLKLDSNGLSIRGSTSVYWDGAGTRKPTFTVTYDGSQDYLEIGSSANLGNTVASYITFKTGPSNSYAERMRIDANGNLLVGTTSYAINSRIISKTSGSSCAFVGEVGSITAGWSVYHSVSPDAASTSWYHYQASSGGSVVYRVLGNGNVTNTNNSYGAISDLKLKENITDATPKLSSLMKVRIVNYNLKTDPNHKQLGVIAQEVEQVFPGIVEETPDLDADGKPTGETTKAVKYSVFVPMLVKAMQEQQEIINKLTQRIEQLEK